MNNSYHSNTIQLWDSTITTMTVFTNTWLILTTLRNICLYYLLLVLDIAALPMSLLLCPLIMAPPVIILLLDINYMFCNILGIYTIANSVQFCNPPAPYIQQAPRTIYIYIYIYIYI